MILENEKISLIMEEAISNREIPGGIVYASNGREIFHKSYGHSLLYSDKDYTYLSSPIPAQDNTIYDLASVSKIFTGISILTLHEKKLLNINDYVSKYIPEYKLNGKEKITIRMLLTHTSGLPSSIKAQYLNKFDSYESKVKALLEEPVINPVDSLHLYSDLGMMILGVLINKVSGLKLNDYISECILNPLRMSSTCYNPDLNNINKIAATEYQSYENRGLVWGEAHDEKTFELGGIAGHAGLFSNAIDLAKVASMLLNYGEYDGKQILSAPSVEMLKRNYLSKHEKIEYGLGWDLNKKKYMGELAGFSTIGHRGFTGTTIVISFDLNLFLIILTNRVHPQRNLIDANRLRYKISNEVKKVFDN